MSGIISYICGILKTKQINKCNKSETELWIQRNIQVDGNRGKKEIGEEIKRYKHLVAK